MKTPYVPALKTNTKPVSVDGPASAAFTVVELLVVIAAIAILAALLIPGLARGNQQAEGDQCMGNLKQLSEAWLMYNSDNRGHFAPNAGETQQGGTSPTNPDLGPGGPNAQWCPGRQDPGAIPLPDWLSPSTLAPHAANIGLEWIQAGLIYPYVKNVQLYLCPADESFGNAFGLRFPHVRSKSMNAWLNPLGGPWNSGSDDANLRVYTKESDLTIPGPANTWLIIDENQNSINDAFFVADPTEPSIADPQWIDCPASYHNGGCGISFCDGHAAIKKWRDPVVLAQTSMSVGPGQTWSGEGSKYLPDILWLVNRTTALKSATSFVGPQSW
ncbi:MAG TPA: H-X9-DG-CTERM domain-containing protein [Candidatus Baltobacteraceae bacterium]|jgi:prepilin-type processing-associated H-X9-DG protein|nr:H-X9-DG-CTERM domain-containing protein [Candidatus Baltobacteraceae bacterium]